MPRPTQNRALPVLADRPTSPPDRPLRHLTDLGQPWPTRALTECSPSWRSVRRNPCIASQSIKHGRTLADRPTPLADCPSNSTDTYNMQMLRCHTHTLLGPTCQHSISLNPSVLSLPHPLCHARWKPENKRGRGEEKRVEVGCCYCCGPRGGDAHFSISFPFCFSQISYTMFECILNLNLNMNACKVYHHMFNKQANTQARNSTPIVLLLC